MTTKQFISLVSKYHKAKVAAEKATILSNDIKAYMRDNQISKAVAGEFVVSVTATSTNRFNVSKFKEDYPELYKQYLESSDSERLYIK
jgi:hypothetical protein